ncbi:MAG: hypothetical protein GY791_08235 [Alphaproteobacteria bacterium]|nr:hypothetical protein [Alphaproteobacteria bacterium]
MTRRLPNDRPGRPGEWLADDFVRALHEDFRDHGVAAVRALREKDPSTYVRVVVAAMTKELRLDVGLSLVDLLAAMAAENDKPGGHVSGA